MERRLSVGVGLLLTFLGCLALTFTAGAPLLGIDLWFWGSWRLWPLAVLTLGLLLLLPGMLVRSRWLGAFLLLVGMPVLATGAILLFNSLFDAWSAWEWLWPVEVLALALAFLLAAVRARAIWLAVPAIVVGVNGVLFQLCVLTGWWEAWSVLWAVEPLALGLALALVGVAKRSFIPLMLGLVLCAVGGLGLWGMTTLVTPWWWMASLAGPGLLIATGLLMLAWGVVRRPAVAPVAAAE